MRIEKFEDLPRLNFWGLDDQKNFIVERFQEQVSERYEQFDPHRKDHYVIRWVKKGIGFNYIDFVEYDITPNSIHLLTPTQVHWLDIPMGSDIDVYIIAFREPFINIMNLESDIKLLFQDLSTHTILNPSPAYCDLFDKMFDCIHSEFLTAGAYRDKIVASHVRTLLFYILRLKEEDRIERGAKITGYQNLYQQFIEVLEEHFRENHRVSEYASQLFVTEKRLNRACKSVTNLPAGFIIQKRIDIEAKRLLYFSNLTTKEIGYQLGFKDPTHFSKFFKNLNHVSPNSYRQAALSDG